jgi:hypothetical protein
MDRLNIVFTNMTNKEIICDNKEFQKKFYNKTHRPNDTFTLKIKLHSNSLHFTNNMQNCLEQNSYSKKCII